MTPTKSMALPAKTLLFVCQANILRSAAAQAIAMTLAPHSDWTFASAGVRALVGHGMYPDVATALEARGISPTPHEARQLTAAMVAEADLILTFEIWQRAWVVGEVPRAVRKVLTVRRAAEILGSVPAGEPGLDALLKPGRRYDESDDFADPIGQPSATVASAVTEIDSLVRLILSGLAVPVAAAAPPENATSPQHPAESS